MLPFLRFIRSRTTNLFLATNFLAIFLKIHKKYKAEYNVFFASYLHIIRSLLLWPLNPFFLTFSYFFFILVQRSKNFSLSLFIIDNIQLNLHWFFFWFLHWFFFLFYCDFTIFKKLRKRYVILDLLCIYEENCSSFKYHLWRETTFELKFTAN